MAQQIHFFYPERLLSELSHSTSGRSQLTPSIRLWGMLEAWQRWERSRLREGMADKSVNTELPCDMSTGLRQLSTGLSFLRLPYLTFVAGAPGFLNLSTWDSHLPFYWAMIRCTASCKDVRILSRFLQQDLVQISSQSNLANELFSMLCLVKNENGQENSKCWLRG